VPVPPFSKASVSQPLHPSSTEMPTRQDPESNQQTIRGRGYNRQEKSRYIRNHIYGLTVQITAKNSHLSGLLSTIGPRNRRMRGITRRWHVSPPPTTPDITHKTQNKRVSKARQGKVSTLPSLSEIPHLTFPPSADPDRADADAMQLQVRVWRQMRYLIPMRSIRTRHPQPVWLLGNQSCISNYTTSLFSLRAPRPSPIATANSLSPSRHQDSKNRISVTLEDRH